MASRADGLTDALRTFARWLHLPDTGVVEIALATVAANRIAGDPVWLLLTGPPSSGKTEVLTSLLALHDIYLISTLTEAALLSGTPVREQANDATGGVLRKIGDFGIIVPKDFTSILEMNRDKLRQLLAALREIYDGKWVRSFGTDGGKTVEWSGKIGLVGGVTSAIDSAHSVTSAMGPRFLYYRLPATDGQAQAQRAIEKAGLESTMRKELAEAVRAFFAMVEFGKPPALPQSDHKWIAALASLAARCRSAVDRHSYSRDVEFIHDPESPARLAKALFQLLRGARLIGVSTQRTRELIVKVGLDCIPAVRRLALEAVLRRREPTALADIAVEIGYPDQTTRRALHDMECHGIVKHDAPHRTADAQRWQVVSEWRQQFEIARGTFPKC